MILIDLPVRWLTLPLRRLHLFRLGACAALAGITCTLSAQTLSGVYEHGTSHDAIFVADDATGHVTGYTLLHASALGKALAQHCIPGVGCSLEAPKITAASHPSALQAQFHTQASTYVTLVSGRDPSLADLFSPVQSVDTRYGRLDIPQPGPGAHLAFRGHPILPGIEGNNDLSIVGLYAIGDRDIALVEIIGGAACPAIFHFITISRTGISASRAFGTCSDVAVAQLQHDQLTLRMPAMQRKKVVTYRYNHGQAMQ